MRRLFAIHGLDPWSAYNENMFGQFTAEFSTLSYQAGLVSLLILAVIGVLLTRIFRLPSMLAYLLIGVLISVTGIDLLPGDDDMREIAEFGIAFLMFSIGLEFSIAKLIHMRSKVLGLGPAQMLLTAFGTMMVTWIGYDQGWRAGLAVGLAVAMSSTAIMAKLLTERFELHSRHGQRTMAVLLFQDLAVVPCLIIIPALALNPYDLPKVLVSSLILSTVTLFLMFWIGKRLVNRIFGLISRFHSPELFMLTVLMLVLGLSFITENAGLSGAMGAFIGGILVSETLYRHEVEADIRPFRDVLLGIFFVSIGMMLDLGYVFTHIPIIALGLFLLILGKGIVVMLAALANRTPQPIALKTASQLAIAGEFGIVLITLAFNNELISAEILQSTLTVMLLSMFLSPFIIGGVDRYADWLESTSPPPIDYGSVRHHTPDPLVHRETPNNHVLICGFGRTGHAVAEFLSAEDIAWAAIDVNPRRVEEATHEYGHVVYGRAERPEVLSAAALHTAILVVICFPDPASAERMLPAIRRVRPDIKIIVRAPDDTYRDHLKALGATEVIPEVFESSLSLAEETLRQLDVPLDRANEKIRALRAARYTRKPS